MENLFNNMESAIGYLLKLFLIIGSIFVIGVSILILKESLQYNNVIKYVTFGLITAICLISVLSTICFCKKIK